MDKIISHEVIVLNRRWQAPFPLRPSIEIGSRHEKPLQTAAAAAAKKH